MPRPRKPASLFRYFNSSLEAIRLVVMVYVRYPLSLRNVEDLLFERGICLCDETVRRWWNWSMSTSTTTLTRNAASSIARLTSFAARSHWPSGSRLSPDRLRIRPQLRQTETSCD